MCRRERWSRRSRERIARAASRGAVNQLFAVRPGQTYTIVTGAIGFGSLNSGRHRRRRKLLDSSAHLLLAAGGGGGGGASPSAAGGSGSSHGTDHTSGSGSSGQAVGGDAGATRIVPGAAGGTGATRIGPTVAPTVVGRGGGAAPGGGGGGGGYFGGGGGTAGSGGGGGSDQLLGRSAQHSVFSRSLARSRPCRDRLSDDVVADFASWSGRNERDIGAELGLLVRRIRRWHLQLRRRRFHGSEGAADLRQPIVAMAATPSGGGYWLFGADGEVFRAGRRPSWVPLRPTRVLVASP